MPHTVHHAFLLEQNIPLPSQTEHSFAIPAPGVGVKEHYSQIHQSPETRGLVWHLPSL